MTFKMTMPSPAGDFVTFETDTAAEFAFLLNTLEMKSFGPDVMELLRNRYGTAHQRDTVVRR